MQQQLALPVSQTEFLLLLRPAHVLIIYLLKLNIRSIFYETEDESSNLKNGLSFLHNYKCLNCSDVKNNRQNFIIFEMEMEWDTYVWGKHLQYYFPERVLMQKLYLKKKSSLCMPLPWLNSTDTCPKEYCNQISFKSASFRADPSCMFSRFFIIAHRLTESNSICFPTATLHICAHL